jgi:hypothetical protein
MATVYNTTSDESIIEKVVTEDIDLQHIVDTFLALKAELQALPDWKKTVPDLETLNYWNSEQKLLHADLVHEIVFGAQNLKNQADPIRDAGLWPSQWEDEYQQLVNFINDNTP